MIENDVDSEFYGACYDDKQDIEYLKSLLQKGANINCTNDYGCTPLMASGVHDKNNVVKFLLLNKANIEKVDKSNKNCFSFSYDGKFFSYEIQKLICELYPNVYIFLKKNSLNDSLTLHKWIKDDYPETEISDELGFFENNVEINRLNFQLIRACEQGDLEKVKQLVEIGADIEVKDDTNWTPLIISAVNNYFNITKYLIEKGANIESRSSINRNALYYACDKNDIKIAKYLLLHDADINIVDIGGNTCFNDKLIWQKYELQKILIDKYKNGIHLLKKHGIKIHPRIKQKYPEETISDELGFFEGETEYNLNQEELNKELLESCFRGDLEEVKDLIYRGANIEYKRQKCDWTPLIYAVRYCHFDIVKYLIEKGADINCKESTQKWSLLIFACVNYKFPDDIEYTKIIKYLILNGADISYNSDKYLTCLDYVIEPFEKYEIQKLILEKNIRNYKILKKYNIIHPKIKEEYPEGSISNELGFFD